MVSRLIIVFQVYSARNDPKSWHCKELYLIITSRFRPWVAATYIRIPVAPEYPLLNNETGFGEPMKKQFAIALAYHDIDGTLYDFYAERFNVLGCSMDNDQLKEYSLGMASNR
jgi:hypothetical protein